MYFWKGKFKNLYLKKNRKKLKKEYQLEFIKKKGIIEYPQQGLKILENIIKKINRLKGGVLLIDYGYTKNYGSDTLQSVKSHKKKYVL